MLVFLPLPLVDPDSGVDQGEPERVHLQGAVGRPAGRAVLAHLLGGAGHRVVPHHGDTHQGSGPQPVQVKSEENVCSHTRTEEGKSQRVLL